MKEKLTTTADERKVMLDNAMSIALTHPQFCHIADDVARLRIHISTLESQLAAVTKERDEALECEAAAVRRADKLNELHCSQYSRLAALCTAGDGLAETCGRDTSFAAVGGGPSYPDVCTVPQSWFTGVNSALSAWKKARGDV